MIVRQKRDDFVPQGMKHSDFKIGLEFLSGSGRWRCTDVGKRTIVAIKLDLDHDRSWYNGLPFAVVELFSTSTTSRGFHQRRRAASSMTAGDQKW